MDDNFDESPSLDDLFIGTPDDESPSDEELNQQISNLEEAYQKSPPYPPPPSPSSRPTPTKQQMKVLRWLVVGIGTGATALGIAVAIFLAARHQQSQINQAMTPPVQPYNQKVVEATASVVESNRQLREYFWRANYTTPTDLNSSGLLQKAIANAGTEAKSRIEAQRRDPKHPAHRLHPLVAVLRTAMTNPVGKLIVPAANGKIKSAKLLIKYENGEEVEVSRTPTQVLIMGLTDLAALQSATDETAPSVDLNPGLYDLQQLFNATAQNQINLAALQTGLDPYQAQADIMGAYNQALTQGWSGLPSLIPSSPPPSPQK